jgi:hypothetical protein
MSDEGGIVAELAGSSRAGSISHRQGNERRVLAIARAVEDTMRRRMHPGGEDTAGVLIGPQAFLA